MAYVEQLPRSLPRTREEPSRICCVTGLKVYAGAQALTVANAVAAVLALAAGGIFGTLVGATRAPGIEALQPNAFYVSLTGHGVAALILWPIFFEVAALVLASTVLLNARVFSAKLGWSAFFLMVTGAVMLIVAIVTNVDNAVMFTAYPPLVANQFFYLGYLLFAVGVVLALVNFALSITAARAEGAYSGSLPLLTYGVGIAAILAMLSLASGL